MWGWIAITAILISVGITVGGLVEHLEHTSLASGLKFCLSDYRRIPLPHFKVHIFFS